mgnify:CR=1 FL=1
MRNKDVNNCAYFLFFAIIKTPEVSLSNLWTIKGFVFKKYLESFKTSITFLKDLVPAWTAIPNGLFITIKLLLSSKTKSSYWPTSLVEGLYLIFFGLSLTFSFEIS